MKRVAKQDDGAIQGMNLIPMVELMLKEKEAAEAPKSEGEAPAEEVVAEGEEEEEEEPKVQFTKEAIATLVRTSEESERLPVWRKVIYTIGAFEVFYLVWHWVGLDFEKSENIAYAILCMGALGFLFLFRHVFLWLFFGVFTGRRLK